MEDNFLLFETTFLDTAIVINELDLAAASFYAMVNYIQHRFFIAVILSHHLGVSRHSISIESVHFKKRPFYIGMIFITQTPFTSKLGDVGMAKCFFARYGNKG